MPRVILPQPKPAGDCGVKRYQGRRPHYRLQRIGAPSGVQPRKLYYFFFWQDLNNQKFQNVKNIDFIGYYIGDRLRNCKSGNSLRATAKSGKEQQR
ncbi:hypothetical protein TNCV_2810551 [Trichonephila clavipes]|nr:hypothetical protein TNCV_2810551 [Trichonephila clavipes]